MDFSIPVSTCFYKQSIKYFAVDNSPCIFSSIVSQEQGGNRFQLFSDSGDFRDDSRGYQGGGGRGGQRGARQRYRNNRWVILFF